MREEDPKRKGRPDYLQVVYGMVGMVTTWKFLRQDVLNHDRVRVVVCSLGVRIHVR